MALLFLVWYSNAYVGLTASVAELESTSRAAGVCSCIEAPALFLAFPLQYEAVEYNLRNASDNASLFCIVAGKPKLRRRSGCPVSISLELFGDRWSLLIIRDLMVRSFRTFKEFERAGEGISTNILSDRLQKLQAADIITAEPEAADRRSMNYRLTEKGIDLAPVLLDLLIWGSRHGEADAPCALIEKMALNRGQVLAEVRRRWEQRDPTPLLPWLSGGPINRNQLGPRKN